MAIVSVNEAYEGDDAQKQDGSNAATRMFQVIVDTETTSAVAIINADDGSTSIPDRGDAHPADASLKVVGVGPPRQKSSESRLVWMVPINYTDSGTGIEEDPLDEVAVIAWGFTPATITIEKDVNGAPIENSAGDPFVPGLEETAYFLKVSIDENRSSYSAADALDKIGKVNSAGITIAGITLAAKQALITDYSARSATRNGTSYVVVHFEIEFAATFLRSVLDAGYNVKTTNSIVDNYIPKLPILTEDGERVSIPQKLNGSGVLSATANYIDFETKEAVSFAGLGLPSAFPAS